MPLLAQAPHQYLYYEDGKKRSHLAFASLLINFQADNRFKKERLNQILLPALPISLFAGKAPSTRHYSPMQQ